MSGGVYGALIGLARSVDGAAPTERTFSVFREGLLAAGAPETDASQETARRLREEKWALHPDCRTCRNPCGRRADYAGGAAETARSPAFKAEILRKAQQLAAVPSAETHAPLLYRAVFSLGEDGDDSWLEGILEELDQALEAGV